MENFIPMGDTFRQLWFDEKFGWGNLNTFGKWVE